MRAVGPVSTRPRPARARLGPRATWSHGCGPTQQEVGRSTLEAAKLRRFAPRFQFSRESAVQSEQSRRPGPRVFERLSPGCVRLQFHAPPNGKDSSERNTPAIVGTCMSSSVQRSTLCLLHSHTPQPRSTHDTTPRIRRAVCAHGQRATRYTYTHTRSSRPRDPTWRHAIHCSRHLAP